MGTLLMEHARRIGVEKFVAIGAACAYPPAAPVPFRYVEDCAEAIVAALIAIRRQPSLSCHDEGDQPAGTGVVELYERAV